MFSLTGAVAVWFSHPSVFILAGSAMAITIALICKKNIKSLMCFAAVFSFWLISFLLNYFLVLSKYQVIDGLIGFWADKHAFMPLIPHGLSDIMWLPRTLERALRNPVGIKQVIPAAILFCAGYITLYKSRRHFFFISIFTFILALAASGLKSFPFSQRLILYTAPLFIIPIACGINLLRERLWARNKIIFISILSILMFNPIVNAGLSLIHTPARVEIKPALKILEEKLLPSDVLYVARGACKTVKFYRENYKWPADIKFIEAKKKIENATEFREEMNRLMGNDRVWVMFTSFTAQGRFKGKETMTGCLDMLGDRMFSYEKKGVYLYMYDLKQ